MMLLCLALVGVRLWRSCVARGALDALFERLDAGEVEMTGSQRLLPALLKEALERGLAADLSEHLRYEKGQTSGQARSNTRNGTTKKTVMSEVGAFEIEVPRDRAGSFTPRLVRKGQRRLDGLDSMIISLYAGDDGTRYPPSPCFHHRRGGQCWDDFHDH